MQKGVGHGVLQYVVDTPPTMVDRNADRIGDDYERPYSQNPVSEVVLTQASPKHAISNGWKSFESKATKWY